jgi:hypothetical protein
MCLKAGKKHQQNTDHKQDCLLGHLQCWSLKGFLRGDLASLNFFSIGALCCLSTWQVVLLIFSCQLLQDVTLNLCCLSLKNNKSGSKVNKIDRRRGEKLENMRTEISIDRKRTNSIERMKVQ